MAWDTFAEQIITEAKDLALHVFNCYEEIWTSYLHFTSFLDTGKGQAIEMLDLRKTRTSLFHTVKDMAIDGLKMQGASSQGTELAMTSARAGLTSNIRRPSYLSLTRPISWLLMPWLLASPGHQHPWYWPCRIGRSLSYLRKDFNYLCHVILEEWHKMHIYVHAPSEKFST